MSDKSIDYMNLKEKYENLVNEHLLLKTEYSENFMIESMNDMKKIYKEKEYSLIFCEKKILKLNCENKNLHDYLKTFTIMLNTISLNLKEFNTDLFISNEDYYKILRLESKIRFVQEIMENINT